MKGAQLDIKWHWFCFSSVRKLRRAFTLLHILAGCHIQHKHSVFLNIDKNFNGSGEISREQNFSVICFQCPWGQEKKKSGLLLFTTTTYSALLWFHNDSCHSYSQYLKGWSQSHLCCHSYSRSLPSLSPPPEARWDPDAEQKWPKSPRHYELQIIRQKSLKKMTDNNACYGSTFGGKIPQGLTCLFLWLHNLPKVYL